MRLRAVLAELTSYVTSKGSGKQRRMAFVMRRIAQDVCEELEDSDPETISAYFDQMGKVVSWIGTGDDGSLPEALREVFLPRAEGIRIALDGPCDHDGEDVAGCGKCDARYQEPEELEESTRGYISPEYMGGGEKVLPMIGPKDVVSAQDGIDTELSGANTEPR